MPDFDPDAFCRTCGYPALAAEWRCPECGDKQGSEPPSAPATDARIERWLILGFGAYCLAYAACAWELVAAA